MSHMRTVAVYPRKHYTFLHTKPLFDDGARGENDRMASLKQDFELSGPRQSIALVLVVLEHGHPHICMIHVRDNYSKLPEDKMKVGETDEEAVNRIMNEVVGAEGGPYEWPIIDLLCTFYRPNFDKFMFPYLPPHVTRPKEVRRLFFVQLPDRGTLNVAHNLSLKTVPLSELLVSQATMGSVLASLPSLLSRFRFVDGSAAPIDAI
eukprot:m.206141 g.206141  ORF g.206141 m.206141 type:complete len:206 (-) comp53886_c0_seq3:94-711(-)